MESSEADKLEEAILLLIYNRLKSNSDDTYPQKLYDYVHAIKSELSTDRVFSIIEKVLRSIDLSFGNPDIQLNISLIMMGSLLSKDGILNNKSSLIDLCFTSLGYVSKHLNIENWDQLEISQDYSIQNAYLKCLLMICTSFTGNLWLCENDEILLTVFHLMSSSNSFYVKQEAFKVMKQLLRTAFISKNNDLIHKCDPYIHQMLLMNETSHLECIKTLLEDALVRNSFIRLYQLDSVFKDKMHYKNIHNKNSFFECLAYVLKSKQEVEDIINKLIGYNNLKGIIIIYRNLMNLDVSYSHEWLIFFSNILLSKTKEKNFYQISDNLRDFILKNTNQEILSLIINSLNYVDIHNLSENQMINLVSCMVTFVKNNDDKSMKKLISETLRKFNTFIDENIAQYNEFLIKFVEKLSYMNFFLNQQGQCQIFKYFRSLINLKIEEDTMKQIISMILIQIDNILEKSLENNEDIIDSALEVLTDLLKLYSKIACFPQKLIISLIRIYKVSKESVHIDILGSCIPFVLYVVLVNDEIALSELGTTASKIIEDISTYIISGDYFIRIRSIDAILINFEHLLKFSDHFDKLIFSLSLLITNQTDSEIINRIFSIWTIYLNSFTLKNTLLDDGDDERDMMLLKAYKLGIFHSLRTISKCEYISQEIRIKSLKIINLINNIIKNKTKSHLINKLRDIEIPCLQYVDEQEEENIIQSSNVIREEVLEQMFKDNLCMPTQDLLEDFSDKIETKIIRRKPLINVSCEEIVEFLLDSNTEEIEDQDRKKQIYTKTSEYNLNILDDIIAAKDFTTKQIMDCY